MTDEEAIAHAIRKWKGLRDIEGMHTVKWYLIDSHGEEFSFGISTCALCLKHISFGCPDCPLACVLDAPYNIFVETGNPEPMIAALEAL